MQNLSRNSEFVHKAQADPIDLWLERAARRLALEFTSLLTEDRERSEAVEYAEEIRIDLYRALAEIVKEIRRVFQEEG